MDVVRVTTEDGSYLGEFPPGESAAAIIALYRDSRNAAGDYVLLSANGFTAPILPSPVMNNRILPNASASSCSLVGSDFGGALQGHADEGTEISSRRRWTADLVRRLREATADAELFTTSSDGRSEPDWFRVKERYFLDTPFNPSQLRWKWSRLRGVNFQAGEEEERLEVEEENQCPDCKRRQLEIENAMQRAQENGETFDPPDPPLAGGKRKGRKEYGSPVDDSQAAKRRRGKFSAESCGWCVCKHRQCPQWCLGRYHLPRDKNIPVDLLRMHSLNNAIKVLHMGLRTQTDFERLTEDARSYLKLLQNATDQSPKPQVFGHMGNLRSKLFSDFDFVGGGMDGDLSGAGLSDQFSGSPPNPEAPAPPQVSSPALAPSGMETLHDSESSPNKVDTPRLRDPRSPRDMFSNGSMATPTTQNNASMVPGMDFNMENIVDGFFTQSDLGFDLSNHTDPLPTRSASPAPTPAPVAPTPAPAQSTSDPRSPRGRPPRNATRGSKSSAFGDSAPSPAPAQQTADSPATPAKKPDSPVQSSTQADAPSSPTSSLPPALPNPGNLRSSSKVDRTASAEKKFVERHNMKLLDTRKDGWCMWRAMLGDKERTNASIKAPRELANAVFERAAADRFQDQSIDEDAARILTEHVMSRGAKAAFNMLWKNISFERSGGLDSAFLQFLDAAYKWAAPQLGADIVVLWIANPLNSPDQWQLAKRHFPCNKNPNSASAISVYWHAFSACYHVSRLA